VLVDMPERLRNSKDPDRIFAAGKNEHAVRLVGQRAAETGKEAGAISRVAHQLGFGAESHRSGSRAGRRRGSIPG